MKIDIEVPRKYVRTIPNNRFRIIQDCEGNLQTIFAISLRDDETKKLLSPNTRHSRINRRYESKITRFGKRCFNETTFSPSGLISELWSSVKHSSNINFAVLLRGRPSIPVHGFLVLEFIKFYPGRWWAPLWQKTRDERRWRAGVRRLPSPPLPLGKIS